MLLKRKKVKDTEQRNKILKYHKNQELMPLIKIQRNHLTSKYPQYQTLTPKQVYYIVIKL